MQAPTVLSGAVDTPTFEAYVEHVLAPVSRKASTVVPDHVSAQREGCVQVLPVPARFPLWLRACGMVLSRGRSLTLGSILCDRVG